ncbi:hypothetical protein LCGC14_1106960 [marine sediment metagenome]|uniref:Uncharacterized protein n=1 Tax=marine sediment metagenome TaxID=412755 RepID=A0A0F9MCJ1_9ZZZZ
MIPPPEYYKGWVIQETPRGYFVYSRRDTPKSAGVWFGSEEEAYDCIDMMIEEGY